MAKIFSKRNINFVPGTSYKDVIAIVPGDNNILDQFLDDPYIKSLIADGTLIVPMQVTVVAETIEPVKEGIPVEDAKDTADAEPTDDSKKGKGK